LDFLSNFYNKNFSDLIEREINRTRSTNSSIDQIENNLELNQDSSSFFNKIDHSKQIARLEKRKKEIQEEFKDDITITTSFFYD